MFSRRKEINEARTNPTDEVKSVQSDRFGIDSIQGVEGFIKFDGEDCNLIFNALETRFMFLQLFMRLLVNMYNLCHRSNQSTVSSR